MKNESFILITEKGGVIKKKIDSIRECKRGDLGVMAINTELNNFVKSKVIRSLNANLTSIIKTQNSKQGQLSYKKIENLSTNILKKNLIGLDKDDKVINVLPIINEI